MRGYQSITDLSPSPPPDEDLGELERWESMAIEAVGQVIEFWGFKRNQGRVWALLYLRGESFSAAEVESILRLSKGGVSMLLRDLERWKVISRVRHAGSSACVTRRSPNCFKWWSG